MSDFVECYKHERKRSVNATVFYVTDDEAIINFIIEISIKESSSDLCERERLNEMFLGNKTTLDKLTLLQEEHFRILFPTDKIEHWCRRVMDVDIEIGFYFLSKHFHMFDRNQHEQIIRMIASPDGGNYWNRWLQEGTETKICNRFETFGKLLKRTSNSLGAETVINKLLLQGDAIARGSNINSWAIENAFARLPNLRDEFAKKMDPISA